MRQQFNKKRIFPLYFSSDAMNRVLQYNDESHLQLRFIVL